MDDNDKIDINFTNSFHSSIYEKNNLNIKNQQIFNKTFSKTKPKHRSISLKK